MAFDVRAVGNFPCKPVNADSVLGKPQGAVFFDIDGAARYVVQCLQYIVSVRLFPAAGQRQNPAVRKKTV